MDARMENEGSSPGDAALVARAGRGDDRAFETLFRRHYDMVYSLAYRLLGRREDAEDVAQETFVRAARGLHGFRNESRLASWLYRIALNAARDFRRQTQKHHSIVSAYADAARRDTRDAHCRCEAADTSSRIRAALTNLQYKEREAIVLTVYEGLSHAEAARLVGCAEATISWRVFMARRTLRKSLSKELDDE